MDYFKITDIIVKVELPEFGFSLSFSSIYFIIQHFYSFIFSLDSSTISW